MSLPFYGMRRVYVHTLSRVPCFPVPGTHPRLVRPYSLYGGREEMVPTHVLPRDGDRPPKKREIP